MILNVYEQQSLKAHDTMLVELKEDVDRFTIVVWKSQISATNRTTKQKMSNFIKV